MKKVGKGVYVDTRTGEKIEAKEQEKRIEDKSSIRKTLARLRAIINTNCEKPENIRWVTLTYAENMQDRTKLMKDFDAYRKRLERWLKKQGIDIPEYISVAEPQARGAWHLHVIYIWQDKAPFIENAQLAQIWGHGFTKVKACENVDNIGAYFTAYLADIPIGEREYKGEDIKVTENEKGETKAYIKGGRIELYPSGMNLYRTSRGIRKPQIEESIARCVEKKKGEFGQLTYAKSFDVVRDGKYAQTIIKEYYNKNRVNTRR